MRRILLLAALAAFSGVSAASLPDTVTRDGVAYARRGSRGANEPPCGFRAAFVKRATIPVSV